MRSAIRLLLLLVVTQGQLLFAWERKLSRDGISVDVRAVAGSDFKEFRARMRVKSNLAKATALMRDIPRYTRWMKDCKEAREVQKISAVCILLATLHCNSCSAAASYCLA
jgi:Xaa-Pro aminopeptidase